MSEYHVLKDLAIIFAVSLLVILIFHRIKLPALPGFIVAGVLLGPNALGLVSDAHQVESLAEVGVILLLFTIGIEFSLSRLREMGRQVVAGGGSQVALTVVLAVILVGTLTALGPAAAGASLAVGAFLAGLVISESDYGHQAMAELLPFRDVFISLFFVAVGMLVQVAFLRDHPLLALGGVVGVMGGKALLAAVGPALMGYSGRVALLAGLAVSQIGEFSFVLAREGRGTGLLSEGLYQTFLAVAVLTMLVTPFLLQSGPALLDGVERLVPLDRLLPGLRPGRIAVAEQPLTDHVIVAGYGLNGRNLTAALRSIQAPYLIVELNAQTVQQARARGEPAFYGDATREEILRALGAERARMLVVAISDPAATRRMVRVGRSLNARLHIIARTRYVTEIPELSRLGADVVIPEEFETSIEILDRKSTRLNS